MNNLDTKILGDTVRKLIDTVADLDNELITIKSKYEKLLSEVKEDALLEYTEEELNHHISVKSEFMFNARYALNSRDILKKIGELDD